MNAGRFEPEIIDADEIAILEYVKKRVSDVLERLYYIEISGYEAMKELNDDPTVARFVKLSICEIIRNVVRNNDLDVFVDAYNSFSIKYDTVELLRLVITWIDERIDHYLRTSTAKNAGGLMLP